MEETETNLGDGHSAFHQARRPTFMGATDTQVVTRALFATVDPGPGKALRSQGMRSVLRRPMALPQSSFDIEAPSADDTPPEATSLAAEAKANTVAVAAAVDMPISLQPPAPVTRAASDFGPPMPAEFVSPSNVPAVHTQAAVDYAERLAASVAALRLTSERLAEQARSDALELALLVARRILESELSTNVERFFAVIRSVMRRAGESHRVVVRLHPEDAARVEAVGGARSLSSMAVAQIEISGDPELDLGDCMVEADFGVVDGRLSTRLDEMRRLLLEAMAEEL